MNKNFVTISAIIISCLSLLVSVIVLLKIDTQQPQVTTIAKGANPTVVKETLDQKKLETLIEDIVTRKLATYKPETIQQQDIDADLEELLKKHGNFIMPHLLVKINEAFLKRAQKELDNLDWADQLSEKKLKKILKRAANGGSYNSHAMEKVDLSDCTTTTEKIDRILEEFEGVNHYSYKNPLVKQLKELGEEAIPTLLEKLNEKSTPHWAQKSAAKEALTDMLTEDHKEIILEQFDKHTIFASLITKYKFPEAEEMVMDKIENPQHKGYVNHEVIDAALAMNEGAAIPLIKNHIKTGNHPVHAARKLADMKDVDIHDELISAAQNATTHYVQGGLSKILVEKGMPEGLELAQKVLTSKDPHAEHDKNQIATLLRRYTDAKGNEQDMLRWLEENAEHVQWNESTNRFE